MVRHGDSPATRFSKQRPVHRGHSMRTCGELPADNTTVTSSGEPDKGGGDWALSSISVESRVEGSPGHGNSLAMHLLGGEQEAAQHLLAVLGVAACGETAQVAPQVFEPTFAQVGGA